MSETVAVQPIEEIRKTYTPKQWLGRLKTWEGVSDTVFYVPFVCGLIRGTHQISDPFSHSLTDVLEHHPLVITDLASKIFETLPPILLTPEQKSFERTIYAAPKEAWDTVKDALRIVAAVDKATHRFCIFRMYEEEIPCPLGHYTDRTIRVQFCNLYGNRETYFFAKGLDASGLTRMYLHYSPPIREFVELGDKILGLLDTKKTNEAAFEQFVRDADQAKLTARLAALQQNTKLQEAIAAKPLEESQLTAKQRADCYEMIRMYYQIYGEENKG